MKPELFLHSLKLKIGYLNERKGKEQRDKAKKDAAKNGCEYRLDFDGKIHFYRPN